jgi:predicted site-specific integrase-resolvase
MKGKPPIDREAVRVLAILIGAREAARRLGIKESTLLSWSHRGKWKLPRHKVGRPPIDLKASPGDVLLEYKRLGGQTRTDLERAVAEAAVRLGGMDGEGRF